MHCRQANQVAVMAYRLYTEGLGWFIRAKRSSTLQLQGKSPRSQQSIVRNSCASRFSNAVGGIEGNKKNFLGSTLKIRY